MNVFKHTTWQQRFLNRYSLAILFGVTGSLLIPLALHKTRVVPNIFIVNIPLHSSLEAAGSIILLIITILLFVRFHNDKHELDYPFAALGFLGMGIFDLFHSTTSTGDVFVFSHALSMLSGGFWFGIIGLPYTWKIRIRTNTWFAVTISLWILLLTWLIFFPGMVPDMASERRFSGSAGILNTLSMIGFIIGFIALLRRYLLNRETEIFYIALVAMIHVLSRITFNLSEVWNMEWWLWHFYRLLGSAILFFIILSVIQRTIRGYEQLFDYQEAFIDVIEQKNKELQQFATVTSHDLQEPLRKIRNYSELLEARYKEKLEDKGQDYIHSIVSGATRMHDLINNLQAVTVISERPVRPEKVDTEQLVKKLLTSGNFDEEIEKARVNVSALPTITADRTMIRDLFYHLISNAIKFRSDDRQLKINISGEEKEEYWKFTVRDNGIGFEKRFRKKIFEVFEQLNPADKHKGDGTGTGLAICARIIEKHNGNIYAQSEPGSGSTFTFTLHKNTHQIKQPK